VTAPEEPSGFRPRVVDAVRPKRWTLSDVIDAWEKFGPLVHHATMFPDLDRLTGGGPVFGTRWYVMGAPDACKTLFLSMLAQVWSAMGLVVGMLAVDEEPEDLAQRFIQRIRPASWKGAHFQRVHCEDRDADVLALMREETQHIGVVFYGAEWTIESAAADLAEYARELGKRAAMMVDSVQTVDCQALRKQTKEISPREKITENTKAIRAAASGHKMIVVATSEMNRAAYKSIIKIEQNDMAAAKESGAIEYSARVMLAMRLVPEEPDCIEVKVVKNKHGQSFPAADPFYLALHRAEQVLVPRAPPVVEVEPSLVEKLVLELSSRPRGMTTEALAKALKKSKRDIVATCQSAASEGRVRRENGDRSPWVMCDDVDPDGPECP
jgi:hypothetical protein